MTRCIDRRRAVTLLEIVLATGILVPTLGTLFWFYSSTLETREQSLTRIRDTQLARVILDRIVQELRQTTGFIGGYGTGIYGDRHKISMNTVMIPDKALVERSSLRKKPRPGQFDLRQVDYYIAWDKTNTDEESEPRALGLVRRERRTFNKLQPAEAEAAASAMDDMESEESTRLKEGEAGAADARDDEESAGPPRGRGVLGDALSEVFDESLDENLQEEDLEGAKQELYAPEIKFIEFLYHDGNRWWETWEITEGNSLPQMVMVTIGFVPEPYKEVEDQNIDIIRDLLENEDDIEPLPPDRYSTIVRIPQADAFYGSRVQREVSSLADLQDVQ